MLYRPEAFEPLTERAWDDAWARARIREIAAAADAAFDPVGLWPADPWDAWQTRTPLKGLYVGAAGVLWALDALRRRGVVEMRLDLAGAAEELAAGWSADDLPDWELPEPARAGLFNGETGVLLVACLLVRDSPALSAALADRLLARARENTANGARDLMWGAAGTLLAARAMLEWSGDERWADTWREGANALLASRDEDGCWTHRLYGEEYRGLGVPHGAPGNVRVLLDGPIDGPIDDATRERLRRETAALLERTAVLEDGLANWPGSVRECLLGADGQIRVQWCTGAPGVILSAADCLDEELLLAGARLVWRAGPHGSDKGPCLCHGTAGNGYALLKAFERTGDEEWLARARRFAVHALEQVGRRGRGRFSLWTGDVGVALFAADCCEGRAAYPVIDTCS